MIRVLFRPGVYYRLKPVIKILVLVLFELIFCFNLESQIYYNISLILNLILKFNLTDYNLYYFYLKI